MTMQLWTAPTPNGWKVSILLEELKEAGIVLPEIEVHTISLSNGEQFSDEFTDVNPNQKIPGFVDGDLKLMESCAILQYLADKYPSSLLPQGEARWRVLPWVYWQAANLGPVFGNKLSYTRYLTDIEEEKRSHPLERFGSEAQRLLRVLDKQLQGQPYICGANFTLADIACYPWVRGWKWSKIDITGHANVVAWVERVRARPAVERGLSYGVPDTEIDQWSEERKRQYARMGSSMASNASIQSAN
ncbi:glutathione S-transferase [Pseudomaricurvus alkylphenolicus]|jgi:GST-like protein|uniref:glutathione S-transferase family protein n=1 Tax=Pseudomaricurvus alkylphenolicus TaxID=1306991 RepID=UPI00141ECF24|nr:glutathione binding-like protein [Pseudomaricurvus alkylphenolicus]NIB42334.1 glutathione S-transferase [Pseudomaricurvus alkylphenolicus]